MLKNYIKIAWRHLIRYRLFTALNVFGLAIGICACLIIYKIVRYEFSYEEKLPYHEQIYSLLTHRVLDGKESLYSGVSVPIYQGAREILPKNVRVVPVYGKWFSTIQVPRQNSEPLVIEDPEGIVATDSAYFDMVPYTWLAGNKQKAFLHPENVVLTESRAKSYFPNTPVNDLIGKTLFYNDTLQKTVSGIVRDLDYPTEFTAQEFCFLAPKVYPLTEWTNTNGSDKLYLQFDKPAEAPKVLDLIEALVDQKWKIFYEQVKSTIPAFKSFDYKRSFLLKPLRDLHFMTQVQDSGYHMRKANKTVLYGLMGIGAFLLLLACINYVNLSTALIPQRSREIGVRKTLGSSKKALLLQFLVETGLTVFAAAVLAYGFTQLGFFMLADLLPEGIHTYVQANEAFLFVTALLSLTVLFAAAYPAWLIARVNPVNTLKSAIGYLPGKQSLGLRKGLIVFQYTIAQFFIIAAILIGQQLNYTLQKDLGFDKEAVLLVDIPWKVSGKSAYANKEAVLAHEIRQIAGVRSVSQGKAPLSAAYSSSPYIYSPTSDAPPINRQLQKKYVDTNYLQFYHMELLAGRNLHATDTVSELIINETAAKAYGFAKPEDAIGKMLTQSNGNNVAYPIVGVVRDFHVKDFYSVIEPLALMADGGEKGTLNIRLAANPANWPRTIQQINEKWKSIYPAEAFNSKFYDETIEALYMQEQHLATLIDLATGISIFISCLGLFGLATLTATQKTKEIGIRKVLGATVSSIVSMLSKDFVKLVVLALLIATPLTWWIVNKWLEDFAYRIAIHWWVFMLAGLGAVVIALITVSFQAIKAASANPVKSLRSE